MQTVTDSFNAASKKDMRQISWKAKIAFDRSSFSDGISYFTLDQSLLNGPDILKGPDSAAVLQEWDKYEYIDYSERIISMEWTHEMDILEGVNLGIADVVMDNHDDFFTPGSGSGVDGNVLPYRPIRLWAGFEGKVIPVFIGLTEGMPEIDYSNKTVRFHCIDFLHSIMNRPLEDTELLQDKRVDEILDTLFQNVGLVPSQYDLDTAQLTVAFGFFERGMKLGEAVTELMEAEGGYLFLSPNGIIKFRTRTQFDSSVVWEFSKNNVLDIRRPVVDDIINFVEITGRPRAVQEKQNIANLSETVVVDANLTAEVWINFDDPVTSIDTPEYVTGADTSWFSVSDAEIGGNPVSGQITVSDLELFSLSVKITFSNASGNRLYVQQMELYGTPARQLGDVLAREQDDTSVGKFDERPLKIENDYFQTSKQAQSRALAIIDDMAEYTPADEIQVKGNPAFELGDVVKLSVKETNEYNILKSENVIDRTGYRQRLSIKNFTSRDFFILDESQLNRGVLAP